MMYSRITRNGQVTIPKEVRQRLGLKEGSTVFFRQNDHTLTVVPAVVIPKDQEWFWTPEWQKKEREADEDLERGRYRTFKSAKEATRWLNRKRR